jgi:heat shock protein HtpX
MDADGDLFREAWRQTFFFKQGGELPMGLAKRIILFLMVNMAVVATVSLLLSFFNVQPYLTPYGLDYRSLAIFCLLWGMVGAFISLLLSKMMAKWMMGVQIVDPQTRDPALRSVVQMVHQLAQKAGLPKMPEVGIYDSPEVNAFATGPSRSNSLVAVSSGLLNRMGQDEVEGVLGHEITHIANGDMVTMTLLQGVINAFVMFFARIVAFALSRALGKRDDSESEVSPLVYQLTVFALEIVFMILGSLVIAAFSRYREFRADAGGARLAGSNKMIGALMALQRTTQLTDPAHDQQAFQAFKISSSTGLLSYFASHPPLERRIERLQRRGSR